MKYLNVVWIVLITLFGVYAQTDLQVSETDAQKIVISKETLKDKIMGGWAGQTIGVTFGGPTEFQFKGTMIQDYQPIVWYDGYLKKTMLENPGLYDDIYMDFTFVDIFEKEGLDAPVTSFAKAFANANYPLWHANQAARYNILNGIMPPESGHWINNPHAECIDYQIEADFAGLMSPGMPNTASAFSDKVGHIMNYGDGWYGGVYIGAMYTLAFTSNDINYIVGEGLKTIPVESNFYKCISDVIAWHKQYPDDWKKTWFEFEKKWSQDIGCPEGTFNSFNIDATVNAAYVVLGLLYGNGDFSKTLEISTRAGQDSDCNPSSAGGILGTVLGYKNIPTYWKMGLKEVESLDFKYTSMSLNDVYEVGFKHALQVIQRNGGKINGENVEIALQKPRPVKLEKTFEGHFPKEKRPVHKDLKDYLSLEFEGIGFVIHGEASRWENTSNDAFELDLYLDEKLVETVSLPVNFTNRRNEICWKYNLPKGKHTIRLKLKNKVQGENIKIWDLLVYSDSPVVAWKK